MTSSLFKFLDPLSHKNRKEMNGGDWTHIRPFLNYKIGLERF